MLSITFFTALALYLVAAFYNCLAFIKHANSLFRAALIFTSAGICFHAAHIIMTGMKRGIFPLSGRQESLVFLALTLAVSFLFLAIRYRLISLGVFLLPLVLISMLGSIISQSSPVQDILNSRLFYFHTTFLFLAYTAFVAGTLFAVLYLLQEKELKAKRLRAFYRRLPSLDILDQLFANSMLSGIVLMTAGLASGIYWAHREWDQGWQSDPKVISAICTWLIYLALTSIRTLTGWRGKRMAVIALAGFVSMLLTFWIAALAGGRHVF